jgi:hypothetical protein
MIGINSNINSLVAQQNLNTSQSALSQAITRLSSGKRSTALRTMQPASRSRTVCKRRSTA